MKTQVIGSNEYLIMVISHLMAKHNTKLMWHPYFISSHLISSHIGTTLGGRETCKIYLFLKFARGNPTFTTHQSRVIEVSKIEFQNQNHSASKELTIFHKIKFPNYTPYDASGLEEKSQDGVRGLTQLSEE